MVAAAAAAAVAVSIVELFSSSPSSLVLFSLTQLFRPSIFIPSPYAGKNASLSLSFSNSDLRVLCFYTQWAFSVRVRRMDVVSLFACARPEVESGSVTRAPRNTPPIQWKLARCVFSLFFPDAGVVRRQPWARNKKKRSNGSLPKGYSSGSVIVVVVVPCDGLRVNPNIRFEYRRYRRFFVDTKSVPRAVRNNPCSFRTLAPRETKEA